MEFTRPAWLLLAIPAAYYTWRFAVGSLADLTPLRAKLAIGLRLAIIGLPILALAGARVVKNVNQDCTVFVLDVSDSITSSKRQQALEYVNKALKTASIDQKSGLVVFGGEALIELAPSNVRRVSKLHSLPSTNETDISQALGVAMALFPENCRKKIVLLSDGNETTGKSIEQAILAASQGISIDVVPIAPDLPRECLLDRIICPSNVKIGEPFDLKIVAVAKQATSARLKLLRNGEPVAQKVFSLAKGKNLLAIQQSISKPGNYEYKAILEPAEDTRPENNVALAYTMVKGKPRVLYIEGQPAQGNYLTKALSTSDIDVELKPASALPNTLADLRAYDALILSDVPAWHLEPEQMALIESGVKDLGIGFTMIGGDYGFGAGGYYDTPVEKCLPVEMSLRNKKVLPSLAVVIIMDKSGSMADLENGRSKIELANDAAASVVSLLKPQDRIGIVVCHNFPVIAVPLQSAENKGPIYSQISTIRAEGGGIYADPSLKMAYGMLKNAPVRQKHIIMLADGNDVDDADQTTLSTVRAIKSSGITISTVAIGDGKDVPFLKAAAAIGRGHFYLAQRAQDLKAIFTSDVMTVSGSAYVEEPFVPRIDTASREFSGIDPRTVPPLLGYVATSPKPAARVAAVSHKNDPILASWQYGLGRSVAFTSDCKARWAARWVSWPGYAKIWTQTIRSTLGKSWTGLYQTVIDVEGGTGRVTIDAVDENGNFINLLKFRGYVVGPSLRSRPIVIEQTAPGRYEGRFEAREIGNYVVSISPISQNGKKVQTGIETHVMSIAYPPEYKDIEPNRALLHRISAETSGKFNPPPNEVLHEGFRPSRSYSDLWHALTLVAILLLPLDIAVRRLSIGTAEIRLLTSSAAEFMDKGRKIFRHQKLPEQSVETVEALLQVKARHRTRPKPTVEIDTSQPSTNVEPLTDQQTQAENQVETKVSQVAETEEDVTSRLLEVKRRSRGSQPGG